MVLKGKPNISPIYSLFKSSRVYFIFRDIYSGENTIKILQDKYDVPRPNISQVLQTLRCKDLIKMTKGVRGKPGEISINIEKLYDFLINSYIGWGISKSKLNLKLKKDYFNTGEWLIVLGHANNFEELLHNIYFERRLFE